MTLKWFDQFTDVIYQKKFDAGTVNIPGHTGTEGSNYGLPHIAFVRGKGVDISSVL